MSFWGHPDHDYDSDMTNGMDVDYVSPQLRAEQRALESRVWQTAGGRQIPYTQMEEKHLLNSLRAVRAGTVRGKGTHIEEALYQEVLRRGLKPLPDYASTEEAFANAAVSKLWLHWPRLSAEQVPGIISMIRAFLYKNWVPGDHELETAARCDPNELGILTALRTYATYGRSVDDEAKKRLAEVFRRWTVAMHIEEQLKP